MEVAWLSSNELSERLVYLNDEQILGSRLPYILTRLCLKELNFQKNLRNVLPPVQTFRCWKLIEFCPWPPSNQTRVGFYRLSIIGLELLRCASILLGFCSQPIPFGLSPSSLSLSLSISLFRFRKDLSENNSGTALAVVVCVFKILYLNWSRINHARKRSGSEKEGKKNSWREEIRRMLRNATVCVF